jgi:hypothetical protein
VKSGLMNLKLKLRLEKETMTHHHPQELNHQDFNNLKIKVKFMVTIKFMALIKGENKVGKLKEMLHNLRMMMMDHSTSITSASSKSSSKHSTRSPR